MSRSMISRHVSFLCCYLFAAAAVIPVASRAADAIIPNEDAAVSRLVNRLRPYKGHDRLENCLEGCRSLGVVFNPSCVDRCLSLVDFPHKVVTSAPARNPLGLDFVERAAEQLLTLVKTYREDRAPPTNQ